MADTEQQLNEPDENDKLVWYPMHSHKGQDYRHSHHKDNGGHGSHDGIELMTREQAMPWAIPWMHKV